MHCVMTCIKVMEMSMLLCSFVIIVLCIGNIYIMYLIFYTCVHVFTELCIGIHSSALFVLYIDLH